MSNEVLRHAVEGISDLIAIPGIINPDFADVRSVMENAGTTLIGVGKAEGEKRAEEAARQAINSPLLEISISGAKSVLFSISGGDDIGMQEVETIGTVITESIDPEAGIVFGLTKDERLKKGEIKVTVIASGFPTYDHNYNVSKIGSSRTPSTATSVSAQTSSFDLDDKIEEIVIEEKPAKSQPAKAEIKKNVIENEVFSDVENKKKKEEAKKSPVIIDDEDSGDTDDWGTGFTFFSKKK
jgi:cell division protein FtsZ